MILVTLKLLGTIETVVHTKFYPHRHSNVDVIHTAFRCQTLISHSELRTILCKKKLSQTITSLDKLTLTLRVSLQKPRKPEVESISLSASVILRKKSVSKTQ